MGAHGAVGRSACKSCLYIVRLCFHFFSATSYLHVIHSSAHSTFNYIGYHFNKLILAFNRGDLVEARTIQVLSIFFISLNILCQSVTEVFVYRPRAVQDARASPLRHETWWVKVLRWCFFNNTWSKGNMILSALLFLTGFDLGVNKQLMIEVSGLSLGPPRLPVMPCSQSCAQSIVEKYYSLFPEHEWIFTRDWSKLKTLKTCSIHLVTVTNIMQYVWWIQRLFVSGHKTRNSWVRHPFSNSVSGFPCAKFPNSVRLG